MTARSYKYQILKDRQSGMGLVELLVALALGIGVLGLIIQIFVNSKQSYHLQESLARMQENARHAMQTIGRDVRMTGYLGDIQEYWNFTGHTDPPRQLPSISGECFTSAAASYRWIAPMLSSADHDSDSTTLTVFAPKLAASNNSIGLFSGCIPSSNFVNGTDVLSVSYVGPVSAPDGQRTQNGLYVRTDLTHGIAFRCHTDTGSCNTGGTWDADTAAYYPLNAVTYHIRPCRDAGGDAACGTADDGDSTDIPSLVRVYLNQDGSVQSDLVAEGVIDMQVQYGVDPTNSGYAQQYMDASDIGLISSSANWPLWNQVRTVRIWLLLRAVKKEPGYEDTRTYTLGDHTVDPEPGYRHQRFTMTIAVRNFSG